MPLNLSQELAKSFHRGWSRGIQYSVHLVGIHGYTGMTENVTEQYAASDVESTFGQV